MKTIEVCKKCEHFNFTVGLGTLIRGNVVGYSCSMSDECDWHFTPWGEKELPKLNGILFFAKEPPKECPYKLEAFAKETPSALALG